MLLSWPDKRQTSRLAAVLMSTKSFARCVGVALAILTSATALSAWADGGAGGLGGGGAGGGPGENGKDGRDGGGGGGGGAGGAIGGIGTVEHCILLIFCSGDGGYGGTGGLNGNQGGVTTTISVPASGRMSGLSGGNGGPAAWTTDERPTPDTHAIDITFPNGGGGGGSGGWGAIVPGPGFSQNMGAISGGRGGDGGYGREGGHGGDGGVGLGVLTVFSANFTNAGTIVGGPGGNGGRGVDSALVPYNSLEGGAHFSFETSIARGGLAGAGGTGGAGVQLESASGTKILFTNTGSISGGAGGNPGVAGQGGPGFGGRGGAGIIGSNATIINSGTIESGSNGDRASGFPNAAIVGTGLAIVNSGTIRGDFAMKFLDGVNTLTMRDGSIIQGAIEIVKGSLVFDQPTSVTLSNIIRGDGAVSKVGDGTLTLRGANTYTGGTTISIGLVNFAAANNFGIGRITLDGGGLQWASGTTLDISARLEPFGGFGAGFDTNGNNVAFATPLRGIFGGLWKAGAGTLTLAGNDTGLGPITIVGGTLAVNGKLSSTVTLQGGTISGSGTVDHVVSDGGVISPGNAVGTMGVAGNYSQGASGGLLAEVSGGRADRLNIGGVASLAGGAVVVSALPGATVAANTTYTILSAGGGVAGTFASVNEPYPFLVSSLDYDANNVYLNLQIGGFAAAAQTRTQYAVGTALDAGVANATGDFANILGTLAILQAGQVLPFMTAISGQNYSTFSSTMVQGAQLFMNNFADQTGGGGSPVSNRVALAEACDISCDATSPALWGAWGGALGGLGTIGASAATGGVTYNVGGFAAGLDRLVVPGLRLGVTTGYTTGTQWTSGFSGNGTTDSFLAGLYGNYRQDKAYADAVLGYAYSYNQMWRQISIPTLQQRLAQGRAGSNQFYGQVEGGYRFDLGTTADAFVTPFARLQGYTGTQNGFTETGAQSLNLTVAQQTTNSLRSVIGVQLGGAMDLGWREKLALQFRLGWSHEYANTARPVAATLAGAPLSPFTTYGIAPQRDGAVLGFSANTAIADGTSLYLRYEGNLSGQDSTHALTAGVRMTW